MSGMTVGERSEPRARRARRARRAAPPWALPLKERMRVALAWSAAGILGALALGILLIPLRSHTSVPNLAFVFLAFTIVVASLGGRAAAAATALASALSLNFFLSAPYMTLATDKDDDVVTFLALLGCGVIGSVFGRRPERERAEAERRRRERRYRALVERSSDAVVLHSPDGTITYASPSVEQVLGYAPDEMIGRSAFDGVHPDHLEAGVARHRAVVSDPSQGFVAESLVRRKDGAWRWIESTVANMMHEASVRAVVSNFRDVTERKEAEYLTARVFENAPDGVSIVGPDYRYRRVNASYERRWGIPPARIVGMHVGDLVGAELFERTIRPALDRCLAGEDAAYEAWITTALGPRYMSVSLSPLRPAPDRVAAALLIARDLTEQHLAAEALQRAQAELARVTRVTMLGEITASIAHEVNQPLAAVVMNGNACRRWLSADPPNLDEARKATERIVSDANRAGQVIGRVRALVRRVAPEHALLEVNDVVREALTFTRAERERHGLSLEVDLREGLPPVLGDRVQLQQVLVNLILNGIDAMAGVAEGARRLTVGSRRDGTAGVALDVRDCGRGLGDERPERIFDPFFSTKPDGLGMGLSISRSIVASHGGRIWATPNDGPGVTIRVALPAASGAS